MIICRKKGGDDENDRYRDSIEKLLEMVNLADKKNSMPSSLSGGERQRAAIACAIAKDSDIILGDEVTSALDEDNKKTVMKLLRECANKGKTVILVSQAESVYNRIINILSNYGISEDEALSLNSMTNYEEYIAKISSYGGNA